MFQQEPTKSSASEHRSREAPQAGPLPDESAGIPRFSWDLEADELKIPPRPDRAADPAPAAAREQQEREKSSRENKSGREIKEGEMYVDWGSFMDRWSTTMAISFVACGTFFLLRGRLAIAAADFTMAALCATYGLVRSIRVADGASTGSSGDSSKGAQPKKPKD